MAIHYWISRFPESNPYCGLKKKKSTKLTEDKTKITCKFCLKHLKIN